MSSTPSLKLDWCSHEAAVYATTHWHYSGSMPCSKTVKVGAWEDGRFIGAIVFAYGAQRHLGKMFGLRMQECVELCRVALTTHRTPVTRIVSIALRMLKQLCPGLRAVVSYADCDHGHVGSIYAGGGWVYLGLVEQGGGTAKFRIHGKVCHGRTVGSKWGIGSQNVAWLRKHVDPKADVVYTLGKHKYVIGLDDEMRRQLRPLHKPYPKRAGSADGGTAGIQPAGGGSTPTPALARDPDETRTPPTTDRAQDRQGQPRPAPAQRPRASADARHPRRAAVAGRRRA